jgi:hypothetical protein
MATSSGNPWISGIWEAAQKLVRSWEVEGKSGAPTVEGAGERLIADIRARGLVDDTVAKYELLKGELVMFFGSVSVSSITPDTAARFREGWIGRPSTIQKKVERLRSFFKFCTERDWIAKNPARALKYPKEVSIERKPFEK